VKSVVVSAEEMASPVQKISSRVRESAEIAGQAATRAERNGGVMKLSEAAKRIGDVILLTASDTSKEELFYFIEKSRDDIKFVVVRNALDG
jgi:methyl-accepting chemotaxis protein